MVTIEVCRLEFLLSSPNDLFPIKNQYAKPAAGGSTG
jgi:hypothetical protein